MMMNIMTTNYQWLCLDQTSLLSLPKLWAMLCRVTQDRWVMLESWQNMVQWVQWRREWQTTQVFLPWEPHEQYEKAKNYDTRR